MPRSLFPKLGMVMAYCLVLASCGQDSAKEVIPISTTASPHDGKSHLLTQINALRKKKRLPLLAVDNRLVMAAQDHSNSMAKHRYFTHRGKDGSNFQKRMARHGYPLSHAAENLAWTRNPEAVFPMWLNSKGHRTNMLNKKYTRIGIARTGDYWAAIFAAPDGT